MDEAREKKLTPKLPTPFRRPARIAAVRFAPGQWAGSLGVLKRFLWTMKIGIHLVKRWILWGRNKLFYVTFRKIENWVEIEISTSTQDFLEISISAQSQENCEIELRLRSQPQLKILLRSQLNSILNFSDLELRLRSQSQLNS